MVTFTSVLNVDADIDPGPPATAIPEGTPEHVDGVLGDDHDSFSYPSHTADHSPLFSMIGGFQKPTTKIKNAVDNMDSSSPCASITSQDAIHNDMKVLMKPHTWVPVSFLKRGVERIIPSGGLVANCFSLGSVTLGGGIISMPSSVATSGIIMAILYLLIFNIITIYTMALLGFVMEKTQLHTWEETAKYLFGPGWDYFVGFVLWLSCFGTAIAYISGVSSLIDPILQDAPGTPDYLKSINGNRLITSMIWLVFMLPIIIPKHINSLRYVSAFGCAMVVYFVVVIIVHSSSNGLQKGMRGEMKLFTTGNKALYGLSIFIFSYLCQAVSHSVYFEQKPKPSVKQLVLANTIAMTVCMVLYILAGVFGYFDFADDTKDSILFNYDPINQPYVMVAYVGMFIKIYAAFAMNMIPCRNFTYHCLKWDLETTPYWKHTILVVSTAFVVLMCGLFIPSVNLAFGLVGSLCGGFISFIFPALFWMYSGNWGLKTVGIWHWLATYFLLVAGVIAIVFGTIATIYSSFF